MSAALEVRGLWKRYGSTVAVRDVHLTVERGQMYGLLGPNGSGKTTTLSCALGLLSASGGECRVLGEPATKLHRTKGKVGCVFDVPALLRGHTIRQNLRYQARLRGHGGGRQMSDALERVGLAGFEKRRSGGLSLGQEKRLAIAGAIMGQPELIVLDEPLSGLDPMGVRGMLRLLEELKADGQTLIISSHRLHEMQEILTHAAVILDGEVVKEAPLEDYLGKPGTWQIQVQKPEAAAKGLAGLGELVENPDGTWRIHAPGTPGEKIASALTESGAGLLHFAQERMGLQASFEALVDERRRARAATAKSGGAA
ncbi:Fluoroquinolones export ATP-binding protein [Planctomycetes bacterium Poly30]|uniref:Fluoroquinolones export ATP-binding protein n=1 Tax=Saltatorellus ferox TaxID=2528018 RepID=A0A518EW43_9BACT|nr:Fluoroquinolones export ATP-binding protein [Planctomycetes bacterium Poly30]